MYLILLQKLANFLLIFIKGWLYETLC